MRKHKVYIIHLNASNSVCKKEEVPASENNGIPRTIEVSKNVYDIIDLGWRFVDGKWVAPSNESVNEELDPTMLRVEELKKKLRETDWMVLEILEHKENDKDSPHDDSIYDQRQAWRDEIGKLSKSE